jgi:hypothetical protein
MASDAAYHDSFRELIQAGSASGVQLVRLKQVDQANRYEALPVEFDGEGNAVCPGEEAVLVTNLAEPADATGRVPADTDAVAIDVEGRWIVFLRPPAAVTFPARVLAGLGEAAYTLREQTADEGVLVDLTGAVDFQAKNLAELSLGPGAAVDDDTIVMVTSLVEAGSPATVRYFFDHPAYAKYLD